VSDKKKSAVAECIQKILRLRSEACLTEQIGLTKLYNTVDAGGYRDHSQAHYLLDAALVDCYGWPKIIAQDEDELVAHLSQLNLNVRESQSYAPFPRTNSFIDGHAGGLEA